MTWKDKLSHLIEQSKIVTISDICANLIGLRCIKITNLLKHLACDVPGQPVVIYPGLRHIEGSVLGLSLSSGVQGLHKQVDEWGPSIWKVPLLA